MQFSSADDDINDAALFISTISKLRLMVRNIITHDKVIRSNNVVHEIKSFMKLTIQLHEMTKNFGEKVGFLIECNISFCNKVTICLPFYNELF